MCSLIFILKNCSRYNFGTRIMQFSESSYANLDVPSPESWTVTTTSLIVFHTASPRGTISNVVGGPFLGVLFKQYRPY